MFVITFPALDPDKTEGGDVQEDKASKTLNYEKLSSYIFLFLYLDSLFFT